MRPGVSCGVLAYRSDVVPCAVALGSNSDKKVGMQGTMWRKRRRARRELSALLQELAPVVDAVYHDLLSLHRTVIPLTASTDRHTSFVAYADTWKPTRGTGIIRHLTSVCAHVTTPHRTTPPYVAIHDIARLHAMFLSERLHDVGTVAIPLQEVIHSPDGVFLKFVDADHRRRTNRATLFLAAQLFLLLLDEQDALHTVIDSMDRLVAPPNTPRNQDFLPVIIWTHLARGLQQYLADMPRAVSAPYEWQHPIRTHRGITALQDDTLPKTVDMVQESWDQHLWYTSRFDERHVYDHREEGAYWSKERAADGASLDDDWQPQGWWKARQYRRWQKRNTE